MNTLPCEMCGPENDCTCPPCACVWCRVERGEGTPEERRMVQAHVTAHARAATRREMRASAARMREKIETLTENKNRPSEGRHP